MACGGSSPNSSRLAEPHFIINFKESRLTQRRYSPGTAKMPLTALSKGVLACKLTELVLACVCAALQKNTSQSAGYVLSYIVFGGYIIIISGMIFGFIVKDRINRKTDLFYTLIGAVLFVAAGSLTIDYYVYLKKQYGYSKTEGIAGGALAMVNAIILIIDAILTFKDVNEYTPH
ncbi:hypothetical protein J437_LFUL001243 [Ladona fulva]|uniref:Uncharacterized protein n=1 Tax=Ladona fulva TaxID=123851 RepID=A0A8K0JWZ7_LADFU|nr:hypothetical protein J437_LFUL001243 [Ladona fulva]